jgi:excisionase family DNA binding protein
VRERTSVRRAVELDELGEPLLRTSDVAALLQVSDRTVTNWARMGRIDSVRMPGGHWRFPRNSVRELLRSHHEEAT